MSADPARGYSPRLLRWFGRYVRAYLRRHFTAVRIARDGLPPPAAGPTILYSNHPSWWDPLVLLYIATEHYRERELHAPIDADALRRYPLLRRLGFFGIEPGTASGAREFLRASKAVLATERGMLALTAEGRFSDVRPRPVAIKRGLARLLHELPHARAVPVAVEYTFWNERLPECLLRFGPAVTADGRGVTELHAVLGRALESTLDGLAAQAVARDPAPFATALAGRSGAGWLADLPQRLRARLAGRRFDASHAAVARSARGG